MVESKRAGEGPEDGSDQSLAEVGTEQDRLIALVLLGKKPKVIARKLGRGLSWVYRKLKDPLILRQVAELREYRLKGAISMGAERADDCLRILHQMARDTSLDPKTRKECAAIVVGNQREMIVGGTMAGIHARAAQSLEAARDQAQKAVPVQVAFNIARKQWLKVSLPAYDESHDRRSTPGSDGGDRPGDPGADDVLALETGEPPLDAETEWSDVDRP